MTSFAIAGLLNAINIINEFNGLAGRIIIFILSYMAMLGYLLNDSFVLKVFLTLIAAILGFLIWNFPFGKIFLGNEGAHFISFVIAILAIYLAYKHPEIFALVFICHINLSCKFLNKGHPFQPDRLHLHSLIYSRLLKHYLNCKKYSVKEL